MKGKRVKTENYHWNESGSLFINGVFVNHKVLQFRIEDGKLSVLFSEALFSHYEKYFDLDPTEVSDEDYSFYASGIENVGRWSCPVFDGKEAYTLIGFTPEPKHVVIKQSPKALFFAFDDEELDALESRLKYDTSGTGIISLEEYDFIGNLHAIEKGLTEIKDGKKFIQRVFPEFYYIGSVKEIDQKEFDSDSEFLSVISKRIASDCAMYYLLKKKSGDNKPASANSANGGSWNKESHIHAISGKEQRI